MGYLVPILVFLGLSVLDLGPMYATDRRQTDVRHASSLNAPSHRGGGVISMPKKYAKRICLSHTVRRQRFRSTNARVASLIIGADYTQYGGEIL